MRRLPLSTPAVRIVASAAPGVTTLSLPGEPTVQLNQNDLGIFVDDAASRPAVIQLHLDPSAGQEFTPGPLVSISNSVINGEYIILVGGPSTFNAPVLPFNDGTSHTGWFLLGNFTGAHLSPCGPAPAQRRTVSMRILCPMRPTRPCTTQLSRLQSRTTSGSCRSPTGSLVSVSGPWGSWQAAGG